jgi:hypothetical protein
MIRFISFSSTMFQLWLLTFLISQAQSRIFYVSTLSSLASDSWTVAEAANNINKPWKSLAKVSSLLTSGTIGSNDQIRFERGGEYVGSLDLQSRTAALTGLMISDYGAASSLRPLITGARTVTSQWRVYKGSIYVTTLSGVSAVYGVYVNSQRLQPARWPNQNGLMPDVGSFARMTSCSLANLQFSADFGSRPAGYWVGSKFHFRSSAYTYSKGIVTTHTAGSITLSKLSGPSVYCGKNWGYFFTANRVEELDVPGEWFFDSSASKLYVWLWDSGNPSKYKIQFSTQAKGILLPLTFSGVTITNLRIQKFGTNGVDIQQVRGTAQLVVKNCDFQDISNWCLCCFGTSSVCSNNTFNRCGNSALYVLGSGVTVADNIIANTTMLRNEIVGQGYGIRTHISATTKTVIERNWIMRSGYGGINFPGGSSIIRNNYVVDSCMTMNDCGGIYQPYVTSFEISNNIVARVWGNQDSLPNGMSLTKLSSFLDHCAYLDNYAGLGNVLSNTLVGCSKAIYMHGGKTNYVKGNTFYNVAIGVQNGGHQIGTGNTVTSNLFYIPRTSSPKYMFSETPITAKSVTYSLNVICSPTQSYTTTSLINFASTSSGRYSSTSFCKIDKTAISLTTFSDNILLNPTGKTVTVSLPSGAQFKTTDGSIKTGTVSIPAYSSIILFGQGTIKYDENPYY